MFTSRQTVSTPCLSARTGVPAYIAIHRMEGYFDSTVAMFHAGSSQTSADRCISKDGKRLAIFNVVSSKLKTWAVGNANSISVSIETEGFVGDEATLTPNFYDSIADQCIAIQKGVKATYGHTIPLKITKTKGVGGIVGHVYLGQWYGGSDHTCPGPTFRYDLLQAAVNKRLGKTGLVKQKATQALEVFLQGKLVKHVEYGDGRVEAYFLRSLPKVLLKGDVKLIRHKISRRK